MRIVLVFLLFASSLLGLTALRDVSGQPTADIRLGVGFSPAWFYDIQFGTPLFIPGESLWVNASFSGILKLLDPSSRERSSVIVEREYPSKVYAFKENDPQGIWILRVGESELNAPVLLVDPSVPAYAPRPAYQFESRSLIISGMVRLDRERLHDGGVLLLTRRDSATERREIAIEALLNGYPFNVIYERDGSRHVKLTPYFTYTGEQESAPPLSATVWVEAVSDTPVVKFAGNVPVISYMPGTLMKSRKAPLTITTSPNQSFSFMLPEFHRTGREGFSPLRQGRAIIILNIMVESLVYLVKFPIFLLPADIGKTIVGSIPIQPLQSSIEFTFIDSIVNFQEYDLALFAKVMGVDRLWTMRLIPPISTISLVNAIGNATLTSYKIEFGRGVVQSRNIDGVTYALLDSSIVDTDYSLLIDDLATWKNDVYPDRVRLYPLSRSRVVTATGEVELEILDAKHEAVRAGRLIFYRDLGGRFLKIGEHIWSPTEPLLRFNLIRGDYRIEAEVEGQTESTPVNVIAPKVGAKIIFPKFLQDLRKIELQQRFLSVGVAVILLEAVAAYWVWRRALAYHTITISAR